MQIFIWAFESWSFCNKKIKDPCSQITLTNIIVMKKFKILWELQRCDTETQNEWVLLENAAYRLAQCRVTRNLQLTKNAVSAKHNKTKYACISYSEKTSLDNFIGDSYRTLKEELILNLNNKVFLKWKRMEQISNHSIKLVLY